MGQIEVLLFRCSAMEIGPDPPISVLSSLSQRFEYQKRYIDLILDPKLLTNFPMTLTERYKHFANTDTNIIRKAKAIFLNRKKINLIFLLHYRE